MSKDFPTPRQAAKDQEAFFIKFEVNGRYLPGEMKKEWGARYTIQGPIPNSRNKDVLAIVMFLFGKDSLYNCLVNAGKQLKVWEDA